MGKEWHWVGRTSKKGEGVETTETPSGGCMCSVFHFFDFHPFHFPNTLNQQQQSLEDNSFKSPPCIQEDHTIIPKGAEAPRNSLESEDGTISPHSKEENFKMPKNIIQIKTSGRSRRNLNELSSSSEPSINNSSPGGTKTPTLVARLMGLDLLPHSPSSHSSSSSSITTPNPQCNFTKLPQHYLRGKIQTKPRNSTDSDIIAISTHSLPETPRISSSSSRRSDVDHHRLSLQINKENSMSGDDLDTPRFSFTKRKCDEIICRDLGRGENSSGSYARQIVKQVKESVVSRKVGSDITNTLKNREEFLNQLRNKKKSPKSSFDESSPGKHSNPSSFSPRIKFLDTKNKPNTTTKDQNIQNQRILTKPKPQAMPAEKQEIHEKKKLVPKCEKVRNEKFSSRIKRPPQKKNKEESFIICSTLSTTTKVNDVKSKKSKKNHPLLSNNLLNNFNNVANVLPVKTDPSPATKIPQKQSLQVSESPEWKSSRTEKSSCWWQRYEQEGITSTLLCLSTSESDDKHNGGSASASAAATTTTGRAAAEQTHCHRPEFQYITKILTHSTNYTISSSSSPYSTPLLDPSIFHHLEHCTTVKDRNFSTNNQLGHRWNRRLLFDLVDEILKDILGHKGYRKKLWFFRGKCYQGSVEGITDRVLNPPLVEGLIERVWKRVGEFPCAKCEVLEDIDELIEAEDMDELLVAGDANGMEEEEGEALVTEIEGNIWDMLVHEEITVMLSGRIRKWGPRGPFHHYGVVL